MLAYSLFRNHFVALLTVILLIAGHHNGLAESPLYSPAFTHTWAAFALGLAAILCLIRKHFYAACIISGILFNIHALMALFVSFPIAATIMLEFYKRRSFKQLIPIPFLILFSLPFIIKQGMSHQEYGVEWIRLLNIRSAYHVFPGSWWQSGNKSIPEFLLLTGFGVLGFSGYAPAGKITREKLFIIFISILILLTSGIIFVYLIPLPLVMRAQLFRSSRFLALFSIIGAARWGHCMLRISWKNRKERKTISALTSLIAILSLCALAIPAFDSFLPLLFIPAVMLTIFHHRLHWTGALYAGITLIICAVAHVFIDFQLWPDLTTKIKFPEDSILWLFALFSLFFLLISYIFKHRLFRISANVLLLALSTLLTIIIFYRNDMSSNPSQWTDIQLMSRSHTPIDARILTPVKLSGFRLFSERAIVCEWRDGTQQFFDPLFSQIWWARIKLLQPGLMYDSSGKRLLSSSAGLKSLNDDQLAELCRKFKADYLVLPTVEKHDFIPLCRNSKWTLYKAERIPPPPPPKGFSQEKSWKERQKFLDDVVYPNITKYRKSKADIQFLDKKGLPVSRLECEIKQTRQNFKFGCVLPHFSKTPGKKRGFHPGIVRKEQLERFKEIFNFSIIGYSGKWDSIEMQEGKPDFTDLDGYINWCKDNKIKIEYHFVSGYPPIWLKKKNSLEKQKYFLKHAKSLIDRYGDCIEDWQIVNEKHLLRQSPKVFQLFREKLPAAKLGISDCARFYSEHKHPKRKKRDLNRGIEEIFWLRKNNIKIDFFGFHGHRPFGLWADVREIYQVLDFFKENNIRIHITEFGIHCPYKITGDTRTGRWTPEMQAEYYKLFYTVCFSHPVVDAINLWGIGPGTWMKGSGLLDRKYQPKPAFYTLKKLIKEDWNTSLQTNSDLAGKITFSGFHGDYEAKIKTKDGNIETFKFSISPNQDNSYRFTVMEK